MAEYIERETAANAFDELLLSPYANGENGFSAGARDALKLARDMMRNNVPKTLAIPSADVVERKHGKWIFDREVTTHDGWTYRQHVCSECGRFTVEADNYCPSCGADMRGNDDV